MAEILDTYGLFVAIFKFWSGQFLIFISGNPELDDFCKGITKRKVVTQYLKFI